MLRTLLAVPVLYVLARASQVGALLVLVGLVGLVSQSGVPVASGLLVLALAVFGSVAVGLACAGSAPPRDSGPPFNP